MVGHTPRSARIGEDGGARRRRSTRKSWGSSDVMRHVGHVERASPAPGPACDPTSASPGVRPWKQICIPKAFHPRCRFVLPTPSWHARLEFLLRKGRPRRWTPSQHAVQGTGSRRCFVHASCRSMSLQLSHQLLCHCGVSCANRDAICPACPVGWHTSPSCTAQPTREAMKQCLSPSAPERFDFAGCCTNTARCPDHVLLRIRSTDRSW